LTRAYYGWVMVGLAAAAMVGTLPGRTQGLGIVTEPLLADLGIGRVDYAQLNLWATLAGSIFAIGVGRIVDRLGTRAVLTAVALALGLVVVVMAQVQTFWALAIAVTLTRGLGQSALSVISIAMVGHWFVRRIDTAMAIYSIALSVGFMIAFPMVGAMVQFWGWRGAWLVVGAALVLGLAPASWLLARRNPEEIGVSVDGDTADQPNRPNPPLQPESGHTWQQALATPAFWLFGSGAALYGLVASGIGLFNESILAERGFGADVYYQTLIVTAMTALVGNFGGGWLSTRVSLPRLLAVSLFVLAGGLAALPFVTAITHVMAWATAMGLGGGLVMVLFFSVWPRAFGRRHLGFIQGAAQAMTVLASAVGPLVLAWCVEWTGSYAGVFFILAAIIGLTAGAALVTTLPSPDAQSSQASREVISADLRH
jgi:MFS family permease